MAASPASFTRTSAPAAEGGAGRDAPAAATVTRVRRPPRRFVWFTLGILSLFVARELTNRMTWPDYLMGPLLLRDSAGPADVIVVPAAGLTAACTPNLNSLRRVLLAAKLYRAGRAPLMLFSGGRPRSGDLRCTVAAVMAKMAVDIGVPESAIRVEHESRTTHKNAEMSAPILRELGAKRILLVTDRLHMVRASAAYAHFGFAIERASVPVFEGHRDNVDMLAGGLREYVGIAWYKWKGWIEDPWTDDPRTRVAPSSATPPDNAIETMTQSPALAHSDGPLVLLGASYAGGWKATTLGGVPVVNKGIAGQQSFELLARFDTDVLPANPRAVVLWGFANDVFRAQRPKIAESMARMRGSFTEMIAKARAHGIEPIIATEVTIREPNTWSDWFAGWAGWALRKTSYQQYVNGHILEQNKWLRETAQQQGLLLLDLQPVVSEPSGPRRKPFAQDDGSHISEAGYAALAAYVNPALTAHFRKP
jgi:uncharacterized SAM-binding protein YcdF (DUF218 family)/lysophospholipase L1-like esterase